MTTFTMYLVLIKQIILLVLICSSAFAATSITQHGVTITFDADYTVGQYVTGDYYVVSSSGIEIDNITNTYHSYPGAGYDGVMIDPDPDPDNTNGGNQGFDTRAIRYVAALNLRVSGFPITLDVGESLLSSVSILTGETGYTENMRPSNHVVIVLNCVSSAPAADTFRPPYVSGSKTVVTTSDVDLDLLPDLPTVANTITLASASRYFELPQIDFVNDYGNREVHARLNFPGGPYGGDFAHTWGAAMLRLMVDSGDRTDLANYIVQAGIDLYGILVAGGTWPANGGHNLARLSPILVTGFLLENSAMLNLADSYSGNVFQEWGDIIYVTQSHIDSGPHVQSCLGLPDFDGKALVQGFGCNGNTDCGGSFGCDGYYDENGSQVAWQVLTMEILGLEDEFDDPAYWEWTEDQWMVNISGDDRFGKDRGSTDNKNFIRDMWNAYRESCDDGACLSAGNTNTTAVRGTITSTPGTVTAIIQ